MRLLVRIVANALAILATSIVPGISFQGGWLRLLVASLVFGFFNAIVRPIAVFLSIPALILTLGLFYFIMNGILLWTAAWFMPGYSVRGIVAGILGSLVIGAVNWALHALVGDGKK
jgi:putative membrane protein